MNYPTEELFEAWIGQANEVYASLTGLQPDGSQKTYTFDAEQAYHYVQDLKDQLQEMKEARHN